VWKYSTFETKKSILQQAKKAQKIQKFQKKKKSKIAKIAPPFIDIGLKKQNQ